MEHVLVVFVEFFHYLYTGGGFVHVEEGNWDFGDLHLSWRLKTLNQAAQIYFQPLHWGLCQVHLRSLQFFLRLFKQPIQLNHLCGLLLVQKTLILNLVRLQLTDVIFKSNFNIFSILLNSIQKSSVLYGSDFAHDVLSD